MDEFESTEEGSQITMETGSVHETPENAEDQSQSEALDKIPTDSFVTIDHLPALTISSEMTGACASVETLTSGNAETLSNDFAQSQAGSTGDETTSQKRKRSRSPSMSDKEDSSDVGVSIDSDEADESSGQKMFQCLYSKLGCEQKYPSRMARNQHSKKCFGSFLKWCRDANCVSDKSGKFDTLDDLVKHSIENHGCVRIACTPGELLLPFTLEENFFKFKVFNAKVVACCDIKQDGQNFQIVFVAVAIKSGGSGDKALLVAPMISGKTGNSSDHYVRLSIGLLDDKGNAVRRNGNSFSASRILDDGMNVICAAFQSHDQIVDALSNDTFPLYFDVKNLKETSCDTFNFGLRFKIEIQRSVMLWERGMTPISMKGPAQAHYLTWEEVEVNETLKLMVQKNNDKMGLAMSGIIVPRMEHNMLIETTSLELAVKVVLARTLKTTGNSPDLPFPETTRNSKALILFPSDGMMFSIGSGLRKELCIYDIQSVIVPGVTDTYLHCLKEFGCDVLMTTLDVFKHLSSQQDANLSAILFSDLKAVIFADADSVMRNRVCSNIWRCIKQVSARVSNAYALIGITRCISEYTLYAIRGAFFRGPFLALSVGPSSNVLLRQIDVDEISAETLQEKIDATIEILKGKTAGTRWLIIGDEKYKMYDANFKQLALQLSMTFEQRTILRFDEKDCISALQGNPNGLSKFSSMERSILLTSYNCVVTDQVKKCGGIILFRMPKTKAELVSILPVAINEKGVKKPVFTMCDSHSLENLNFAMFHD